MLHGGTQYTAKMFHYLRDLGRLTTVKPPTAARRPPALRAPEDRGCGLRGAGRRRD